MFLTHQQAEELTLTEAKQHLKLLTKTYDLNKSIRILDPSVWPDLDAIADTLLYLEDRIHRLEVSETLSESSTLRWAERKETV